MNLKKKRFKQKRNLIIWGVLFAVVLASVVLYQGLIVLEQKSHSSKQLDDKTKLSVALKLGRLAELPNEILDFKIDGTSNRFSATYLFKFKSSQKDINKFIEESAGLKNVKPELFSKTHKYPNSKEVEGINDTSDRYPWFSPVIDVKGRKYEIPQDENANYGGVIIDDLNNIVYVYVSHS